MSTIRVGLIGDYNPDVKAHQAIPRALELAAQSSGCEVQAKWLATAEINEANVNEQLLGYDALWCVPASPYASMQGALSAIRLAREGSIPFLGTCGGFQHALIEFARNRLNLREADHAESSPDADFKLISKLSCALVGVKGKILFKRGTRIREIYGVDEATEGFRCSYGLDPEYASMLSGTEMSITAVDEEGAARVIEIAGHPFFIATLFQPELSALEELTPHPLVRAYVQAAAALEGSRGQVTQHAMRNENLAWKA